METLGPIELTVVREYNSTPAILDTIDLPNGSTVDLGSIAIDLTGDLDGVLLQAVVNWDANFNAPDRTIRTGSADITFELLRDGNVIYRVNQTAIEKEASVVETFGDTFKVATLIHLDTEPLTGLTGQVAYTLRATNIVLVPPVGEEDTGAVSARVGAVTFVVQEVEGTIRGKELVFSGVERVYVDENAAPLALPPASFPIPLTEGSTIELATLGIKLGADRDGILLAAAVNWSATFDFTPVVNFAILQPSVVTITFELLRDGEPIYRITQSATQSIVPFARTAQRLTTSTYEIAALLHFDPSAVFEFAGFTTYTLRATNISITPFIFQFDGTPVISITAAAGAVTLIAKKIEACHVKKRAGGEGND